MPRKQTTIAAIDESIAKWKTRMKRALHALDKLEQKKKRLIRANVLATMAGQGPLPPVTMIAIAAPVGIDPEMASLANDAAIERDIDRAEQKREAQIIEDVQDTSKPGDIPTFLRRDADVDALKAERKRREAAARKAMPLSDKAAAEYIKAPRKRKA